jgi:hypothetical protein
MFYKKMYTKPYTAPCGEDYGTSACSLLSAVLYSIEYFNKLTAVLAFYFQGCGSAWLEWESEFLSLL